MQQKEIAMNKITDRIVLITILFLLFTLWITYLSKNPLLSIIISSALCIIIGILIRPRKKKTVIKADEYLPKLCAMSNKDLGDMIIKVISKDIHPKISPKGLITADGKMLILPLLKMREITADEICKLSESAKRLSYKKLILITYSHDKTGYEKIKPYLSTPVEFLGIDKVLNALEKCNDLPEINKKQVVKQKFSILFKSATKRKNGKYFLISGLSTAFLSVFTPLTLYYLIFSTIMLTASICCFLKKKERTPSVLNT